LLNVGWRDGADYPASGFGSQSAFESLRDLPFLIALSARWQRAGFSCFL